MAVTDLGPNDAWLDDVDRMVAEGISSFKIFMAYPNVLMVDDRTIYKLMERTKQLGALVCVHAENGTVIDAIVQEALAAGNTRSALPCAYSPTTAEAEAVHRVVAISELAGGARSHRPRLLRRGHAPKSRPARDRGLPVQGETCTQYLVLSSKMTWASPDSKMRSTFSLRRCARRRIRLRCGRL